MEPACLGMMAQRSRLLWATARASRVSSAPGSKSGRKTAAACGARASGGAAAVGGDVEQDLRGVWRGGDVDGRAVDGGAQLHVASWLAEESRSVLERA